LKKCGYKVSARVLDAQWLGVPQMRKRLIFVGVRNDLSAEPFYPKPLPYYYTIRDALPWIISDKYGVHTRSVEVETDISKFAIGQEWEKLKPGESSDKYLNLVRPDPDKPSPCVTQTGAVQSAASVTHPTEKRKFSIAELKRICGFPDDFKLTGTYAQQWERLGRAVPPVMMEKIASTIRDRILLL